MARRTRSSKLETRTTRLKLAVQTKPHTVMIAPNIHLGYRRNANGPGSWSVKAHGWLRKFAISDDHEDANNDTIMDFWQALEKLLDGGIIPARTMRTQPQAAAVDPTLAFLCAGQEYEAEVSNVVTGRFFWPALHVLARAYRQAICKQRKSIVTANYMALR